MRTKFLPIIFLFLSFCAIGQGTGEVIITEYYNRPLKPTQEQLDAAIAAGGITSNDTPNEGHTEWFEIYNTTDSDVVMDGWTLTDASSSSNVTTIGSFTIPAKSYAAFTGFHIPDAQGGVEFDYIYDYKKPSFNNESSYADEGDTSCPDGVIIAKADGTLVDEVRYDYGYGEYIGNIMSGSCNSNTAAIGIPAAGSSSKVSFMLAVDPAVMNSADNDLPENWSFSEIVYDEAGNQRGTPGLANDGSTTSVNDPILNQAITVYPNPANNVLTIGSDLEGEFSVVLFNVMGEQVKEINVNNRSIDISQLSVGIYSMKISLGEKSTVKKVVVQR